MRIFAKCLFIVFLLSLFFASISTHSLAENQPDLQPVQIAVTTVYAGVNNTITAFIANNGTAPANNFEVKLEAAASGNEYSVIGIKTGSVPAKDDPYYYPPSISFNWSPASPGDYSLRLTADSANVISESDEANNVLTQTLQAIQLAPVTVKVRVEGKTSTLWTGSITFTTSSITDKQGATYVINHPTALGALARAAELGNFSYIVSSAWGPLLFIEKVGDDSNSGLNGWLYRVDWQSPSVAAVDYSVASGAEILFYFGGWAAKPLRTTVNEDNVLVPNSFNITVEEYDGIAWSPAADATVQAGSHSYKTGADGQVLAVTLPPGGYTVRAIKETCATYIRSNSVPVLVYVPLSLQSGWNFISFPRRLASGQDTAQVLFGTVDTAGHSIFKYDTTVGWVTLAADNTINPLEGIWVYSASATELRPVFDINPRAVPPARRLKAGWNSIGYTDFVNSSANSTLTSVENQWATLLGFDAAAQTYEISIINNAPDADSHAETREMRPWKGYWLYVTDDCELAAISS